MEVFTCVGCVFCRGVLRVGLWSILVSMQVNPLYASKKRNTSTIQAGKYLGIKEISIKV